MGYIELNAIHPYKMSYTYQSIKWRCSISRTASFFVIHALFATLREIRDKNRS